MSVAERIEDCEALKKEYFDLLYKDCQGWVTVASKNPEYHQHHYKNEQLLANTGTEDIYVSQNTFYIPKRKEENLKELRTLYVDLDCYKTNYSKEAVLYFLQKDFFNQSIPEPTAVVDSGRGLYLIWKIEPVPYMAINLWKYIENYLCTTLKEFGADAKACDAARILRPAGTINTKSGTVVKLLEKNPYVYSLKEIQQGYLPEVKKLYKVNKNGEKADVKFLFNPRNLYHDRIKDIEKLCNLRDWDLEGEREEIIFLYRYFNCCFSSDAKNSLKLSLELNKKFKNPLSEKEATTASKSAESCFLSTTKKYRYTNKRLIELLDISLKEQMHLKTIIGEVEHLRRKKQNNKLKRRNKNGLTSRQQKKADNINQIKQLNEKNLKPCQIAEQLELSKQLVNHYLKLLTA